MKEFTIGNRQQGQRMDKYLFKILDRAPASFVYKMLRKKNIVLNGKKASGKEILKKGDSVKIWFSDETFDKFSSQKTRTAALDRKKTDGHSAKNRDSGMQPEIIYEDDDILILNKPAGMLSQKASKTDYSVNDWVCDYLLESGQLQTEDLADFRPSICNRLDRNTSGLLAAGKTVYGLQYLGEMFRDRSLKKYYRCLVRGEMAEATKLRGWLVRDRKKNRVRIESHAVAGGSPIRTAYRPVCAHDGYTHLEVHLITGRTHQIRAHLASIGHPILGDGKYGDEKINRYWRQKTGLKRQLLHAYRMEFPDGRVFAAPLPGDFLKTAEELALCPHGTPADCADPH